MFNPNYDNLTPTSQTKEENQIGSQWEFDKHGYMYGMKEYYMYIFNKIVPRQVFISEEKGVDKGSRPSTSLAKTLRSTKIIYIINAAITRDKLTEPKHR